MEKPHTSTKTTTSATDFYNSMIKAILCGSPTANTQVKYGPPDIYVECEVKAVEPCEECQEFDCYGCEYKGVKEHHE